MDPLTAALNAYIRTLDLIILLIERTPPNVSAEQITIAFEDLKTFRKLFQHGSAP